MGPATPVPPPHPRHRAGRWTLNGPHDLTALQSQLLVPVKARSPIYRAIFKDNMRQAGLREHIAPQVWTIPWNVHSRANHHGHSAFTDLAPYVFKVALSTHRLVSLTDRTVTVTYRTVGSARLRPTPFDVIELLRRFLQHVLPYGFMKVRHFGWLHASCAIPLASIRLMIVQAHPLDGQPLPRSPPLPRTVRCPTCGAPMRVVMRLWTSPRAFVDTG
ncbi:MAG: transposase [Candidatus Tectimicrobiota bacterium]